MPQTYKLEYGYGDKGLLPYELLQVDIQEDSARLSNFCDVMNFHRLPIGFPSLSQSFAATSSLYTNLNTNVYAPGQPLAFSDASKSNKDSDKSKSTDSEPQDVKACKLKKRCTQQKLRRLNESMEEKLARRQKNAERNRQRRANTNDHRVTIEKSKNRLRQRIKREIARMLKTKEKRDDFLKETFQEVANVFSQEDYNVLQQQVADTIYRLGIT